MREGERGEDIRQEVRVSHLQCVIVEIKTEPEALTHTDTHTHAHAQIEIHTHMS